MTEISRSPLHPMKEPELVWGNSSKGPYAGPDLLEQETYDHAPHEGFLTNFSDRMHTTWIAIDDLVPPDEFKRYNRSVPIHKPPSFYSSIELKFVGMKPWMHSIEDIAPAPKGRSLTRRRRVEEGEDIDTTAKDAVDLLNQTIAQEVLKVDSVYTIKLLNVQCPRSCRADESETTTFSFTNASQKVINIPCTFNRNMYLAFDVINPNPISACVVRFDVRVLMVERPQEEHQPRRTKARANPSAESGTTEGLLRARPNASSGTAPIGSSERILDIID